MTRCPASWVAFSLGSVCSAASRPSALGEDAPGARPSVGGTAPAGSVPPPLWPVDEEPPEEPPEEEPPCEDAADVCPDCAGPEARVVGFAPDVAALVRTGVGRGHNATFAATTTAITATMTLTRTMVRFRPLPKIEPRREPPPRDPDRARPPLAAA